MKQLFPDTIAAAAVLAVMAVQCASAQPGAGSPQAAAMTATVQSAERATRDAGVPEDYKIGSGDILSISVWKEPDASVPSVVVRPDGKIAMPLLKDISVAGLTPKEVERNIADGLSKLILTGADVTVVVTAVNSKKIYVMGAARKEGIIPYTYKMTAMQAIGEAGGLNEFAKRKKIYVLRKSPEGELLRFPFNYDDVIRGQKVEQNIELQPGDTLVIPQ
jgi:polysaccharide export outer membrane protein